MLFRQIVDPHLAQNAYLIGCQRTGEALIVDPERDVDRYLELAAAEGLRIVAVAETHIHADFLSGARELAAHHEVQVYLSALGGPDWSYGWGGDLDVTLLGDGDLIRIGGIELQALHTPGHTPEHLAFLVTDRGGGSDRPMGLLSGDFVFVGDLGRPDLLESAAGQQGAMDPAARTLFRSVDRFVDLPDYLQVWPAHGAGSACGKALGAVPSTTVGYERLFNPALAHAAAGEASFVSFILDGQPEPPLYFARMKRLNRDGVPLLGELPRPQRIAPDQLAPRVAACGGVVVDTRRDRPGFMAAHVAGALYAPFDRDFPTVVGSYVRDEPLFLIAEPADMEPIVRDLVRIGYDRVEGYVDPDATAADELQPRQLVATPTVTMPEMERLRHEPGHLVVDVRGRSEFVAGHVPDAVNIAHTRLLDRIDEIPSGRTLLVHCQSGARAAAASALLERAGHEVICVDDRFERWPGAAVTS